MKATVNRGYINISNTWYKLQNKAQISKQEKTLRFQTLSFSFKIKSLHIVFSLYVVFYLSFLFPPRFRPMLFSAGLRCWQGQITPLTVGHDLSLGYLFVVLLQPLFQFAWELFVTHTTHRLQVELEELGPRTKQILFIRSITFPA